MNVHMNSPNPDFPVQWLYACLLAAAAACCLLLEFGKILKILEILKVALAQKNCFSRNVERDAGFESIRFRMTPTFREKGTFR